MGYWTFQEYFIKFINLSLLLISEILYSKAETYVLCKYLIINKEQNIN